MFPGKVKAYGEPPGARGLNGHPRVSPHSYKEPALKARRPHLLVSPHFCKSLLLARVLKSITNQPTLLCLL